MKIELESQDIQAIAGQVLDTLKPYLSGIGREKQDEIDACGYNHRHKVCKALSGRGLQKHIGYGIQGT
jgi:hypothetical protein